MGSVQIDIEKKERGFKSLTLSDENVVRYLILYRDKVDSTYGTNINVNFNQAGDTYEFNRELMSLYISLDETIEMCNFRKKELRFLKYLFEGYSITDVIDEKLFPSKTAYRLLDKIATKIVESNKIMWRYSIQKQYFL